MGFIYNIGIYLFQFAIFIASFFNEKARKLRNGQAGALKDLSEKIDPNARYIWFHAASLGEFEQGRPVIEMLKKKNPETKILLTFFSPSGYEPRENYPVADLVAYLPPDTRTSARKFVKLVNPSKVVFIKYEYWPNYILELQKANVPIYSISAIFRPTQYFFRFYGVWNRNLLKSFAHIFVQDQNSLKLLADNGFTNISVAGDTRFDRVSDLAQQAKSYPLIEKFVQGSDKVIVAGSTWPKDEELLVRYLKLHPDTKLILVPHETKEAHILSISKLLKADFVRYSELNEQNLLTTNCIVVDTMGLLSSIYRYANVAYLGGGFGVGIHNTLEAAVWGVPVIFGPNYQKFREALGLIAVGGAFSISRYELLEAQINSLLKGGIAGKMAGGYVKNNTGATNLIIKTLTH